MSKVHPKVGPADHTHHFGLPDGTSKIDIVDRPSLVGAFCEPNADRKDCLSLVQQEGMPTYIGYHDCKARVCPLALSIDKDGSVNVQLCQRGHNEGAPVHNLSLDRLIAIVESVIMTEKG